MLVYKVRVWAKDEYALFQVGISQWFYDTPRRVYGDVVHVWTDKVEASNTASSILNRFPVSKVCVLELMLT